MILTPQISGGGGGILVYKRVADLADVTPQDKQVLEDAYKNGQLYVVNRTGDNTYHAWIPDASVPPTYHWYDATGAPGTPAKQIKAVRLQSTTPEGDQIYELILSDDSVLGTFTIPKGDSATAYIKLFGTNVNAGDGRVRYDTTNSHWYFEVRQSDGTYSQKFEIGDSAIVDVVRLVEGNKPTNIAQNQLAIYNRSFTESDGTKVLRPQFVTSDGEEYGLVVCDMSTGNVVYRIGTGAVRQLPTMAQYLESVTKLNLTNGTTLQGLNHRDDLVTSVDLSGLSPGGSGSYDGGSADTDYTNAIQWQGGDASTTYGGV